MNGFSVKFFILSPFLGESDPSLSILNDLLNYLILSWVKHHSHLIKINDFMIFWISKLILMAWLWVSSWRIEFEWICIRIMILTYWSYYLKFFSYPNLFFVHLQFLLFIKRRDLIIWMNAEFFLRWTLRKDFSILNFEW